VIFALGLPFIGASVTSIFLIATARYRFASFSPISESVYPDSISLAT
jgi:hypothetical protein